MNPQFNKSPTKNGDKASASFKNNDTFISPQVGASPFYDQSYQDLDHQNNYSEQLESYAQSYHYAFNLTHNEQIQTNHHLYHEDYYYRVSPLEPSHFVSSDQPLMSYQELPSSSSYQDPLLSTGTHTLSAVSSSLIRKTQKQVGSMKKPAAPRKPICRKVAVAALKHVQNTDEEVFPAASPVVIDLTDDRQDDGISVFVDPVVIDLTGDEPVFAGSVVTDPVFSAFPTAVDSNDVVDQVAVRPAADPTCVGQVVDPTTAEPIAAGPLAGDEHPLFADPFDVDPVLFDPLVFGPLFVDPAATPFFEPHVFEPVAADAPLFEPLAADSLVNSPVVFGVDPVVLVEPVAVVGPVEISPVLRHVPFEVRSSSTVVTGVKSAVGFFADNDPLVVGPGFVSPAAVPAVVAASASVSGEEAPVAVLRHVPSRARSSSDANEVFADSESRHVRKKRRALHDDE